MMKISFHPGVLAAGGSQGLLRRVEAGCWLLGLSLLGYYAGVLAEGCVYQAYEASRFRQALAARPVADPLMVAPVEGGLFGRLDIPRIGLSVIVLEGTDARTLRLGVGHVPESALPGADGNIVLGGHRDTFFRPLQEVRTGDTIQLTTLRGTYRYRVDRMSVVDVNDTAVLAATSHPTLTLVTCYPFHYVGPAPERFIIQAERIEPGTDGNAPVTAPPDTEHSTVRRAKRKTVTAGAVARPVRGGNFVETVRLRPTAAGLPELGPPPALGVQDFPIQRAAALAHPSVPALPQAPAPESRRGIWRMGPVSLFKKLAHAMKLSR